MDEDDILRTLTVAQAGEISVTEARRRLAGREHTMTAIGSFRVFFNRHGAAPLVWCIAPECGGWEIAVADVDITAPVRAVYQPKPEKDEDDGKPSAWLAVDGLLTVLASGHASIGAL